MTSADVDRSYHSQLYVDLNKRNQINTKNKKNENTSKKNYEKENVDLFKRKYWQRNKNQWFV